MTDNKTALENMPDEIWVNKSSEEKAMHGRGFRTTHDYDVSPNTGNTVKYRRDDLTPTIPDDKAVEERIFQKGYERGMQDTHAELSALRIGIAAAIGLKWETVCPADETLINHIRSRHAPSLKDEEVILPLSGINGHFRYYDNEKISLKILGGIPPNGIKIKGQEQ